jgi:hypothetical protein
MSSDALNIRLKINLPVIFFAVLLLHLAFLNFNRNAETLKDQIASIDKSRETPIPISFKNIRTVGSPLSKIKDSTYLSKAPTNSKTISPDRFAPTPSTSRSNVSVPQQKHPISLGDLSAGKQPPKVVQAKPETTQRPGTRPQVMPEKQKALSAISLKGSQIRDFAESSNAASISGDPRTASLNNSDILVNLEVPEGVNPDELNKYEMMFYGFQRRTAINYINSFYKNLDKFDRENPHMAFPLTDTKQTMTGRLTFDEKGNLKQIKMIRWSNVDKLQEFFVDVLKNMDGVHNPPQALWEKTGEFSIFFSLVING